ncbi:hypothetical protein DV737_g421, partial [Chaetothyriales sp. CBS 132003]
MGGVCDSRIGSNRNTIHRSTMDAEGSDRPDTTSSVALVGTWDPSLTLPDVTGLKAFSAALLNPIESDSTSTTSAWSKQSSSDTPMFSFQPLRAPMQPPRLSEAAKGLAKLGFSPREWRTYLRDHSEIFNIPAADFLEAAQQAVLLDRTATARNYLDCMNLVWARSLLSEAAWEAFLESLIRNEGGQGNETHKKISKMFTKSTNKCLGRLKKCHHTFLDQAYYTASMIPQGSPPVDQEMFDTEFLNSFNLDMS